MQMKAAGFAVVLATLVSSSANNNVAAFGIIGQYNVCTCSTSFLTRHTTPHQTRRVLTISPKPRSLLKPSSRRSNHKNRMMTMFGGGGGGIEELKQMAKEGSKLTKTVRKTPTFFKFSGYAAIPVGIVLGAVITPSRRAAASAVGSAITGVAGYIGKNRLDAATEEAAKPALAQVIIDYGIDAPDIVTRVKDVQEAFGVHDEDFSDICADVYKRYLVGMVKTPITKTAELKELSQLRTALNLNNLSVGEAHGAAAKEFYRQTLLFTPMEELEDQDHPDRMSMDKLLFLSERAFRSGGETEEAFKFEMSRVAKAFDLKLYVAMDRVAEVAEPFYRRALTSARAKLDPGVVSSDMLLRARESLGIDELTAKDMHIATYADEVRSLLGRDENSGSQELANAATLKFPEGALERLEKLQEVLGLDDAVADYEIAVEASPLFEAKTLASMNDAIAGTLSPEKAWKEMVVRQKELLFKDGAMKNLLKSLVINALGKPLEETMTFAKVNNEAATYDKLLDALEAKEACIAVLKQSGWADFDDFDGTFFDPKSKSSACGFLSHADRLRLYRIFLTRSVKKSESGKELTDALFAKVKDVQGMLGLPDSDVIKEFNKNFGPELSRVLNMAMFEIIGDDSTPELVSNLKNMVDKVVTDYRLSDNIVAQYAGPLYGRAVAMVSQNTPGGVPTKDKMDALDALRDLLKMTKEDTYPSHVEVFGSAYKTGVLEAMGSTGIIRPEFRGPLNDLRDRLGVSEEASKKIFLSAVEEKMIPMVEFIVLELERTMLTPAQLARKRQKDFGEDYFKSGRGADGTLGIGADANIMTDCMNLIDFYTENDIVDKEQHGTKNVEKKVQVGDEEVVETEEVPVYEFIYPITALKSGAIEPELAELLYRQFVVGGFTTQGPQGERYEAARATFGGILGLSKEKMEEVTSSIGSTVYENYIGNSMKTKGALDQQDMMFLANIQSKLGLSEESSEKMLLDTQKKILSEEADALMSDDVSSPEAIKEFREKCNSMGMELGTDVGISKQRLVRMFEQEVSPGLTSGEISVENAQTLTEIQESLGLTPEEAEKILESLLDKRAKATLGTIRAELLRGREDSCVPLISRLVRFAQFVNGDLSLEVDESTGWTIFNLFEKMDSADQDSYAIETNKELLKTALGLA